jgi:hypothetical protein
MNPLEEIRNREFARLRRENTELAARVAELEGRNLIPEERLVLQVLNAARDYITADAVAQALKLEVQRADWLLGRLVRSEHITETSYAPAQFMIRQKGKDVLYNPSV